jgi:hypothetical protein
VGLFNITIMRERYIEMRNRRIVDWQFIYDYCVSKGFTLGVNNFNLGAQWLMVEMESILSILDREYELTLLYDKNNNFIRVIQ